MTQFISRARSILVTVMTMLLLFSFSETTRAFDLNELKQADSLKDMKGSHVGTLPMATFKVPVQISKLPPAYRGSQLIIDCGAFYRDAGLGLLLGRTVRDGLLGGGSFQGEVSVPANEMRGMIAGDLRVGVCIARVRKGDGCMVVGAGCASGASECSGAVAQVAQSFTDCDVNAVELLLSALPAAIPLN